MREQTNDSVGHTTNRRPAWNKCRLNHGLECLSSFNTHVSHSRQWFNVHFTQWSFLLFCNQWLINDGNTPKFPGLLPSSFSFHALRYEGSAERPGLPLMTVMYVKLVLIHDKQLRHVCRMNTLYPHHWSWWPNQQTRLQPAITLASSPLWFLPVQQEASSEQMPWTHLYKPHQQRQWIRAGKT